MGLLLHDVGKLALPASILKKAGRLDEEEFALVRTHPLRGLDLVSDGSIGPLTKSVIRSHDERWRGDGYPDGRAGLEIPEFARIAAVADVFDAITSSRVYSSAAPQHPGVQAIVQGGGTEFDPSIVESFRKVVAPYPPGSESGSLTGGAAWWCRCRRGSSSRRRCGSCGTTTASGSIATRSTCARSRC